MRKKLLFRSWLLLALMLVGAGSAWGKTKTGETTSTLYQKASTDWTTDDLSDWTGTGGTASIDGGLKVSSTNTGWTYTKSLNISEDAVVTLTATLTGGGATGREGSYDYLKIGGVSFRVDEQKKESYVDVDGNQTTLATGVTRSSAHTVSIEINTQTGAVSYTMDGTSGTATSTTAVNSVVFGHYRAGNEGYAINPVLNSITVSQVAPIYTYANIVNSWDFTNGWTTNDLSDSNKLNGLVIGGTVGTDINIYNNLLRFRLIGGSVGIPVTEGQIVTITTASYDGKARNMTVNLTNAVDGDGNAVTSKGVNNGSTFYVNAEADGYITLTRPDGGDNGYLAIRSIIVENAPDVYFSSETCSAELIALNINEPTLNYPDGAVVTYTVSNTKVASTGGENHSGDLMALNTGVTTVTATVEYKGNTYTASYTLTISADDATYVIDGNTYTLTGPGKLGERVVNGVPKMVMEFGENDESITNITIVRDEASIGNVATTLDSNGWQQLWYEGNDKLVHPVQGTFYTFKPTANGKLTVKGFLRGGNSAYLVDADNLAPMPSDVTGLVNKTYTSWTGATGLAGTGVAPAVNGYQMVEKYELTVSTTGDIMKQTVTNLPNGNYTVVLQANAVYTNEEWRGIATPDGWSWDDSEAANIAYVYADNGTTQVTTPINAVAVTNGVVSANGQYTLNVTVTNGTLTLGLAKSAIGTNWHTIQIESLTYNDALTNYTFTPLFQSETGLENNTEVDVEAILEAGKTYYLYANIPSSNGVNAWGTYQLQSFTYESAWHFANRSVVVPFEEVTNYQGMEVVSAVEGLNPSITYTAIFKGDITGTYDPATGKILSIEAKGDDANKGGAIVVLASDGTDNDVYVITVPYKNHVWDFWGIPTRGGDYPKDLMGLSDDNDFDWAMNYETRTYEEVTRNLNYLNEPILTAAQAVNGDNAAFIGETAGIVVNANAKTFGLRANVTNRGEYENFKAYFLDGGVNQAKYASFIEDYNLDSDEFTAEKFEELKGDGYFVDKYLKVMLNYTDADLVKSSDQPNGVNILAMTVGSTIVIPHVRVGSHIAIKWYRHSPNNGDHILLTNAKDLNGNAIVNGVNVVAQGRGKQHFPNPYGWLEFVAAGNEGEYVDVTLTCEKGWTHIKAIAISEDFFDTDLRITNNNQNSAHKTVFNTSDGSDSNTYSTSSSYTFSEIGVSYTYHLEDITGNIEGNYTINGGEISFNQNTQGTATLVLTAFSNGYAIDREWLPIKVGAFGDTEQEYPYTWSFTNIIASKLDNQSNWQKDGSDYTVTTTATTSHLQDNELKKNPTDEDGVAEFDELGIETPTNTDGTPTKIDLTITDNGNGTTTTTVGDEGITLVVPDVPADATVYVKVVPNSNSTVNITNKEDGSDSPSSSELDDNTTVYTIDGADEDVKVNLKNIEIQSIAVTNIFKEARMASASDSEKFYNTDCQPKVIDYSLTNYYTGYDMKAMYITNENFDEFDYERETAVVTPVEVNNPVPANTGLIVYTSDNEVLHPLFVPDVNTTVRQDVTGNMLVGVIFGEEIATEGEETGESAEPTYTTSTEKLYKYVVNGGSAAQTLVDYKNGIGTYSIVSANSKITENQTMLTETGVKFDSNISSTDNYVEYTGSFKSGDVVTLSSIYNSTDTNKSGKVQIIDANGNTYDVDNTTPGVAVTGSVTLTADTDVLKFGRKGGTGTVVSSFTVTRPGTEGEVEKVATDVTIYTGDVAPAESGTYRYLFTNQYSTVGKDNSLTSAEPGFYRLKAAGGKLKSNRAYLVIGQNVLQGNSVKAIYLKSFFNDDPDDDFSTVIELVEGNNAGIDMNGTFYTISGVKIQGMPTKSGIYIQNGKKIMVK